MKRRIFSFLTAFVLLLNLGGMALAATVDLTEEGSISVDMRYHNLPVPGGDLTLYRVGEVVWEDGAYGFRPTGDFADFDGSFADIQSPELAEDLAEYAREHNIAGQTKSIGIDGSVTFDGLTPGLYLLVQHVPAIGYYTVNPFLVSIPHLEDGEYNYHVDASPKVEPEPVIPTTPSPSTPDTPTTPSVPEQPGLPDTGQLNWPIPVMALLGLTLFIIGWALCFRKRDDRYEK